MRTVTNSLRALWMRVRREAPDVDVVHGPEYVLRREGPYDALQEAFSAFADLLDGHAEYQHAARAWRTLAEDVNRPLMVPVMGHFSTGKSTFLNALLGDALLCTDVLPSTATVTVLKYGPQKQLRAFFPDRPPRTFPFEELREMASEGDPKWKNLREQLSYIEVTLPHSLLKEMTLVDTPGLNSIHGSHRRVTKDFVERADAIIWLFACPQVGTKTELEEIRKLPEGCRPYAVINQIDLLDPCEQPIDDFLDDVGRRLGASIHPPIGVSAKLALHARDGGGSEALAASRWESFVHILEKDILAGSAKRKEGRILERISSALDLILAFSEPKRDEIRNITLALAQGKEYEQNLLGRIQDLAQVGRRWQGTAATTSPDIITDATALSNDVHQSETLNQRREAMLGVIDGVLAESEQLKQEESRMKARLEDFQKRLAFHRARVDAYLHSGLFGGPPVLGRLFDGGGRDRIEAQEAELNKEASEGEASCSHYESEAAVLSSRSERVEQECNEFVAEVQAAIVQGVKKLEHDLEHRGESQARARLRFKEYAWVRTILSELADHAAPQLENSLRECTASLSQQGLIAIAARLERLRLCAAVIEDDCRISESASGRESRRDGSVLERGPAKPIRPPIPDLPSGPGGWVPVAVLGLLAAMAIFGMWQLISGPYLRAPILAAESKSSNVVPLQPEASELIPLIPDEHTIRQFEFGTLPDDRQILGAFYGNVNPSEPFAIWRATQLPPGLDRSRLMIQDTNSIAFRIVHREEHVDGDGAHRLFISVAGTRAPPETFRCHDCPTILGVIVLRQEGSIWHVEGLNRSVAVVGENGEPADEYSIVRWGADRYGLLLAEHSLHQGEEESSATLVGLVDAVPIVIGTFDLNSHNNCGGIISETVPCRSERIEKTFTEAHGDGAWDLQIRKQVTKGLVPGESPNSVRTFQFDGQKYRELTNIGEVPTVSPDVPVPMARAVPVPMARAVPPPKSVSVPPAVMAALLRWRDTTISEDIDSHLRCYASVLDTYFLGRNYTQAQIRADKVSFFRHYPRISKYRISGVRMDSAGPSRVTLSFRKEWEAFGRTRSAGAVRSELTFTLVKDKWKIIAESDRGRV